MNGPRWLQLPGAQRGVPGPNRIARSWVVIFLVAVLWGVTAAACAGDNGGNKAPSVVAIETSTPVPVTEDFGQSDVSSLLDTLQDDMAKYKWAAGCIWVEGAVEGANQFAPAKLLALEDDPLNNPDSPFAAGSYGFTSQDPPVFIATIYQPDYAGTAPTNLVKVEGDGYLCYQPE